MDDKTKTNLIYILIIWNIYVAYLIGGLKASVEMMYYNEPIIFQDDNEEFPINYQ
jgi:hypothetical protein